MSVEAKAYAVQMLDASFVQDGHSLLHEVNLQLEDRHSYAVLGANGAGKSSLLQAIKGLIRPISGSIEWHPNCIPAQQTLAGQKPDLLPRSAWENLRFVAGTDHDALNRAISICEHLDLLGDIHTPAFQLSLGKQQQVNLVRALMFNPPMLLLDEPLASLDARAINLTLELLADYKSENTLVLSTHTLAGLRQIAESVIFVDQGEVMEVSAYSKFIKSPKSNAARRFMREFNLGLDRVR